MAPSLLRLQAGLSPAETLELARQAPEMLRRNHKAVSSSPLQTIFSAPETADLWTMYENLLLSCLRAGHDDAAHQVLERLVIRFGDKDERLAALKGLVKEAEATDDDQLQAILDEYDALLAESGTNIVRPPPPRVSARSVCAPRAARQGWLTRPQPIYKRKIALLRSMGRTAQSITALNHFLDFSPTDSEAWAELADLYTTQGLYPQAIHALEELLVLVPNAWNVRLLRRHAHAPAPVPAGCSAMAPSGLGLTVYRFMPDWVRCPSWPPIRAHRAFHRSTWPRR